MMPVNAACDPLAETRGAKGEGGGRGNRCTIIQFGDFARAEDQRLELLRAPLGGVSSSAARQAVPVEERSCNRRPVCEDAEQRAEWYAAVTLGQCGIDPLVVVSYESQLHGRTIRQIEDKMNRFALGSYALNRSLDGRHGDSFEQPVRSQKLNARRSG